MSKFLCKLLDRQKYDLVEEIRKDWFSISSNSINIFEDSKFINKLYGEYSYEELDKIYKHDKNCVKNLLSDYLQWRLDFGKDIFYEEIFSNSLLFDEKDFLDFVIKNLYYYEKLKVSLIKALANRGRWNISNNIVYYILDLFNLNKDKQVEFERYLNVDSLLKDVNLILELKLIPRIEHESSSSNEEYLKIFNSLKIFNKQIETKIFWDSLYELDLSIILNPNGFLGFINVIDECYSYINNDNIDKEKRDIVSDNIIYFKNIIIEDIKRSKKFRKIFLENLEELDRESCEKDTKYFLIDIKNKIKDDFLYNWDYLKNDKEIRIIFTKNSNESLSKQFSYVFGYMKDKILEIKNHYELCEFFTGHNSKAVMRFFMEEAFRDGNLNVEFLKNSYILKRMKLSREEYLNSMNNLLQNLSYGKGLFVIEVDVDNFLKLYDYLKENYSLDKFITYLKDAASTGDFYLGDTVSMIQNGIEHDKDFVKKLKSRCSKLDMYQLHEYANRIILEMGLSEKSLEQKEIFDKIHNEEIKYINEEGLERILKINVPMSGDDLVKIGIDLSICVGTARYDERINGKFCYIISLKDDSNYSYCIELLRNSQSEKVTFGQTKGFGNREMPNSIKKSLENFLVSKGMIRETWKKSVVELQMMESYENQTGQCYIPKGSYLLNISSHNRHYNTALDLLLFVNSRSEEEKRNYCISEESPAWWDDEKDSVFNIDNYYMLFLEGKLKIREESKINLR